MNYAVYVKINTPQYVSAFLFLFLYIVYISYVYSIKLNSIRFFFLDNPGKAAYIYLHTYCTGNHLGQKYTQNVPPQEKGLTEPTPRARESTLVRGQHLLRFGRYCASKIRNASIGTNRWHFKSRRSNALWRVSPNLLSSRGRFCPRWASWAYASAAWPQGGAQAGCSSDELYRDTTAGKRKDRSRSTIRAYFGKTRHQRSPSQYRTRNCTEKKTLTPTHTASLPSDALKLYETLRSCAMGSGVARTGLTAVIYHGMLNGLELTGSESTPPLQRRIPTDSLPSPTLDTTLVRLLANMVLQSQSEVTHVY